MSQSQTGPVQLSRSSFLLAVTEAVVAALEAACGPDVAYKTRIVSKAVQAGFDRLALNVGPTLVDAVVCTVIRQALADRTGSISREVVSTSWNGTRHERRKAS